MERRYLSPSEVANATINAGITKAKLSIIRMLLLGIFAGFFIGLGAFGDIVAMQTMNNIDIGLMKLIGASVFPVGLMLVIIAGAELFTGNCLMTMSVMDKKITLVEMLRNWIFVFLGNFLGAILLAYLIFKSDLLQNNVLELAANIGEAKLSLSFQAAFIRGTLCNIVVVLAVWLGAASLDIISRIFASWFPIMLFVLSGYEHCIANMFFIPLAKFAGINVSWWTIWSKNLIPVTLGNILGGAVIVPVFYYIAYILPAKKDVN